MCVDLHGWRRRRRRRCAELYYIVIYIELLGCRDNGCVKRFANSARGSGASGRVGRGCEEGVFPGFVRPASVKLSVHGVKMQISLVVLPPSSPNQSDISAFLTMTEVRPPNDVLLYILL